MAIFVQRRRISKPAKPSKWGILSVHITSGTFTAPETAWYRVYCIGASGNGGLTASSSSSSGARGGGGGGSGGMAVSSFLYEQGQSVPFSISNGTVSFSGMTATQGGAGGKSTSSNPGAGGAGGSASGGNLGNYNGYVGGTGGAPGNDGTQGANVGMLGGEGGYIGGTKIQGGGGGGGARLPTGAGTALCPYIASNMNAYRAGGGGSVSNSGYQGYPTDSERGAAAANLSAVSLASPRLYGGGGGRGGDSFPLQGTRISGGNASNGTAAVLIIEKGVY